MNITQDSEDMAKDKKQERWFRTDVDFENSFKFWFALQWQNHYIHIFLIFFTLLILEVCNLKTVFGWVEEAWMDGVGTGLFVSPFTLLPLACTVAIVYKGFWQYFDDLKHGRSR